MESLVDKVERMEQRRRKWRKIRNITMLIIVAVLLAGGSFYYYFPFAKGIKTGRLNYVVYKGIHYEMLQSENDKITYIIGGVKNENDPFIILNNDSKILPKELNELLSASIKTILEIGRIRRFYFFKYGVAG